MEFEFFFLLQGSVACVAKGVLVNVSPSMDQFINVNSMENVTFSCDVRETSVLCGLSIFRVVHKRKQSLRSLRQDLATAVKDDHPIYEKMSPIEILQWCAEAMHLGKITADKDPHQYREHWSASSQFSSHSLFYHTDAEYQKKWLLHELQDLGIVHHQSDRD